jgi:hypothetical protein
MVRCGLAGDTDGQLAALHTTRPLIERTRPYSSVMEAARSTPMIMPPALDADDQSLVQSQITALEGVRVAIGTLPAPAQTMPLGASHHEAPYAPCGHPADRRQDLEIVLEWRLDGC